MTTEAINATSIKLGVSTGVFSTAVVFTDPAYKWMALIGAIVGMLSTIHTIYSDKGIKFTKAQITVEMIKGFVLGVASIPLSFLAISQGVLAKMLGIDLGEITLSLSLVASFLFSWYATPILDHFVKKVGGDK